MGDITDRFGTTFRDYTTIGVPASGAHDPDKREIRQIGNVLDSSITQLAAAFVTNGVALVYATQAALFGDLSPAANKLGLVYNDGTKNGVYIKVGASGAGSWTATGLMLAGPKGDEGDSIYEVALKSGAIPIGTTEAQFIQIIGGQIAAQATILAGNYRDAAQLAANQSGASRDASAASAEQASLSAAAAQAAGPYATTAAGLAAVAEGAAFLVQGTGGTYATLYRKVNGAGVAQNLSIASLAGVQAASDLAAYIATARPILRRAFSGQRHSVSSQFRALGQTIVAACTATTTDGKGAVVQTPGGQYSTVGCWIRDMSMTIATIPEFFDAAQILGAYRWYKGFVKPTTFEVPDHITLAGQAFYKPGGDDSDPFTGVRATADGGPFLLQQFWSYFVKTGDATTFNAEKAFLLNLLDTGLPYSAAGAVYVDPNNRFFQWGFQDSVIATGNVLFCSVLAFIGYRQLAEMAFDTGDYTMARYCVDRAKKVQSGVNATLWDNSIGFYRCADYFSTQPDVWGTALAVYSGLAPAGYARRISANLGYAWGVNTNDKPEVYYRGGIRHGLRSRDFKKDAMVFEGSVVVAGISDFDTYQNGAYWNTATAWVVHAIGLTAPDIAGQLAVQALFESSFEEQFYRGRTDGGTANPAPAEWVSILNTNIASGVSRPKLGASNYLTSIAALLSIRADDCAPFTGAQTILTVSEASGPQSFPNGTWVKLFFDKVEQDEMLAADPSRYGVVAPFTGRYQVEVLRQIQPIGATVQAIGSVNVNGTREENPSNILPSGYAFTLGGKSTIVGVTKGVVISADGQINGPNGTGPYPGAYVGQQAGDSNAHGYNALRITYLGNVGG